MLKMNISDYVIKRVQTCTETLELTLNDCKPPSTGRGLSLESLEGFLRNAATNQMKVNVATRAKGRADAPERIAEVE